MTFSNCKVDRVGKRGGGWKAAAGVVCLVREEAEMQEGGKGQRAGGGRRPADERVRGLLSAGRRHSVLWWLP